MSPTQAEDIHVIVARIDERVKADRKAFAVYSQSVNENLAELKKILTVHVADNETLNAQMHFMVNKLTDVEKTTKDNATKYENNREKIKESIIKVDKKIDKHIKKDRPIGLLTDNHNFGLITVSLIILWTFIDKVSLVFELLKKKYLGT